MKLRILNFRITNENVKGRRNKREAGAVLVNAANEDSDKKDELKV